MASRPPNSSLQPTAIPLRGLSAAELRRYACNNVLPAEGIFQSGPSAP
jgi:hypothetical protein